MAEPMPSLRREAAERKRDDAVTRRGDHGMTLVEVVITITLMSMVVLAVMTAVLTSVRASITSRHTAELETVLINVADGVNRAPKSCSGMDGNPPYWNYVLQAVNSQWPSYTGAPTVEVWHYVPASEQVGETPLQNGDLPTLQLPGDWVLGACEMNDPQPLEAQRVVITVSSPDERARRSIEVVKSDV